MRTIFYQGYLNETQVKEVYGGEGKVKVKKKNKNKVFSFKYTGPERAAKLLEGEQTKWKLAKF